MKDNRLLLVNAWAKAAKSDLLCAPGGGVEPHTSLPDNLIREVYEETGLTVAVGDPCMVNEFHAPDRDFHQVDVYFRCTILAGETSDSWTDVDNVVTERHWVTRDEMAELRVKPDSLAAVAWGDVPFFYDPLEPLIR